MLRAVYYAAYNFVQFWDGRAGTLAEQAAGPPLNPVEMACQSFDEIIAKLEQDANFTKCLFGCISRWLFRTEYHECDRGV